MIGKELVQLETWGTTLLGAAILAWNGFGRCVSLEDAVLNIADKPIRTAKPQVNDQGVEDFFIK